MAFYRGAFYTLRNLSAATAWSGAHPCVWVGRAAQCEGGLTGLSLPVNVAALGVLAQKDGEEPFSTTIGTCDH